MDYGSYAEVEKRIQKAFSISDQRKLPLILKRR